MARPCTICTSEHRDSIDAGLAVGESTYSLADRFNVSASAVQRHSKRHVSPALATMRAEVQEDERSSLLDFIERSQARAERLYLAAVADGHSGQALAVLKEMRGQLELLGKATGELETRPVTVVNIQSSEEWQQIRAVIFAALVQYPEARAAVSGRLLEIEGGPS